MKVVGDCYSEITTGLCLGNTWRNGDPTVFTPLSPSGHRIDYIAFRQERLDKAEFETCCKLGKSLHLSTQCDHVPVHVRLPPARRWRRDRNRNPSCPRWNHAALNWAMRDESICEAYRDSVEQALIDSNIVNYDWPLDDWHGSVMGIIQQVASHHLRVKSTSPRRHWMTPEAWSDIVTRQAQVSKLVEYRRALLQIYDSQSIVFGMWHITARLGVLERRIRASCGEAEARYAASTCAQLRATLRDHDYRAAREHCRLLAGHSRRSVKPRAVSPEKALDPGALDAHEEGFWSDILACSAPQRQQPRHGVHLPVITLQDFNLFKNRRSRWERRRRHGRFLQSSTSSTWPVRINSACSGTAF